MQLMRDDKRQKEYKHSGLRKVNAGCKIMRIKKKEFHGQPI